jgi:hypothetical protein
MTRISSPFMMAVLLVAACLLTSGKAIAQSYSGNWPLTVFHSQHADGKYCLTLTDDGEYGWPHSGPATLVSRKVGGTISGSFQLIDNLLMVTFGEGTGTGELASLLLIAPAGAGDVSQGAYEMAYGPEIDSGVLVFGTKDGC